MGQLSIANVITISVSEAPAGLGEYNTSNLAVFSDEAYNDENDIFSDDGYKIYLEPTEVAKDFGTASQTAKMANAVFSQTPNILAGNGYLVVIPMAVAIQHIAFSATPAAGTFLLNFDGDVTTAISWDDTAEEVQAKVRTLTGLEGAVVTGSITITPGLSIDMRGTYDTQPLMTITSNTLATGGSTPVTPTVTTATAGETYGAAISRTNELVQYFGCLPTLILDQTDTLEAATIVQPLKKLSGFVSRTPADIEVGGKLSLLTTGNFSHSRGLYYASGTAEDTLDMSAAYFGRGLSTNFSGSLTTSTMHLKDLNTIQPDLTMTQTLLNKAQVAGADTYPSIQGVPKVFCSGANSFFDQVYNLLWFVGDLEIRGFNYLATTSTKIPQTESGMDGLKGAYRGSCEQAVTNGYCAPGRWTSATTFGNQQNFLQNIEQLGYYIFSTPISQQSQAARASRAAPLVQIALKEAGAIHSSTVIVFVNP